MKALTGNFKISSSIYTVCYYTQRLPLMQTPVQPLLQLEHLQFLSSFLLYISLAVWCSMFSASATIAKLQECFTPESIFTVMCIFRISSPFHKWITSWLLMNCLHWFAVQTKELAATKCAPTTLSRSLSNLLISISSAIEHIWVGSRAYTNKALKLLKLYLSSHEFCIFS